MPPLLTQRIPEARRGGKPLRKDLPNPYHPTISGLCHCAASHILRSLEPLGSWHATRHPAPEADNRPDVTTLGCPKGKSPVVSASQSDRDSTPLSRWPSASEALETTRPTRGLEAQARGALAPRPTLRAPSPTLRATRTGRTRRTSGLGVGVLRALAPLVGGHLCPNLGHVLTAAAPRRLAALLAPDRHAHGRSLPFVVMEPATCRPLSQ